MLNANINIIVVDDHSLVIEGMKSILSTIDGVALAATANNAFEAMAALRTGPVDVNFVPKLKRNSRRCMYWV